ncbi:protein-disulfide reductase DsbD [Psychrobacter sp. HD31]|uniref:protein-disulfide reductase DsbD n=1 Tax=Psychrobacter sp. HD31 TaxID=3112003 RepID=UPI003DA4F05C
MPSHHANAVSLNSLFNNDNTTSKFLPVEQAFDVTATVDGQQLHLNFDITDGHYVYQDKIKLGLPEGTTASKFTFNQPVKFIEDPLFGRVAVFDQTNVVASANLSGLTNKTELAIQWQGCAKAGLCYPPQKIKVTVDSKNDDNTTDKIAEGFGIKDEGKKATNAQVLAQSDVTAVNQITSGYTLSHQPLYDADEIGIGQKFDPFGLASNPAVALGLIFLAGLGLSLTPCVLPMLPIVANIVAQQNEVSAKRAVALSGSYALGVAVAYGLLGALIAYVGESLGIVSWLQNPIVLIGFAFIFLLLGLYMLELVVLRLPLAISQPLQKLSQSANNKLGSVSGSFLVGLLSALVVSPCVTAPLSGALFAVAAIGNVGLGFIALFLLGLGLSLPLVIFAATQGKVMLKAGEWMNWVKQGFAYLMFALAIMMLERVFVSSWMLALWSAWFVWMAYWLWRWAGKWQILSKLLASITFIWAICLAVGAITGSTDSMRPLSQINQPVPLTNDKKSDIKLTQLAKLDEQLAQQPKVVVDIVADWCVECRIMEKNLFVNPPAELNNWQLIKLDITDADDSKAVLARYKLFGPPALLYYKEGQLQAIQVGETKRKQFEQALNILNKK